MDIVLRAIHGWGLQFLWLSLFLGIVAAGQEPAAVDPTGDAPQIDVAAVLRLGDHVQHVDGYQAGPDDAFCQAMELPADDIDKWFICILTTNNCPYCDELRRTWEATPELVALGSIDQKKSWSHFGYWNMADASKAYKFQHVRTTGYPTIVVQPPKSGVFGPATDIVYQSVGSTKDGKELARQIREAVKLRVTKYPGNRLGLEPVRYELDPPLRLGNGPPPVEAPRAETKPISGSNRFPPLPFDPDGTQGLLPLVRPDQMPEVPPRELLGGRVSDWLGINDAVSNILWGVGIIVGLACMAVFAFVVVVVGGAVLWKLWGYWAAAKAAARLAQAAVQGAASVAQSAASALRIEPEPQVGVAGPAAAVTPDLAAIIAAAVQEGVVGALQKTKTSVASRSRSTAKKT